MSKLHYITILLLVILIAAFSNWLLSSFETKPLGIKKEVRHDPDYFIDQFVATQLNQSGKPRYRLEADKLNHYPDDDSIELTRLKLKLFRVKLPAWTAEADEGLVLKKGTLIKLKGHVVMQRPKSRNEAAVKLVTRNLVIYPQKEYAETAAAVKITSADSIIEATGMKVYLADGRLELLSDTRGKYEISH